MNQTHKTINKNDDRVEERAEEFEQTAYLENGQVITKKVPNQRAEEINMEPLPQIRSDQAIEAKETIKCSKKRIFLISGVIVVIIALILGLTFGLTYRFKPHIIEAKPIREINFSDGSSVVLTQILLQDKNLFEQDVKISLIKTQTVNNKNRRILQGQSSEPFFSSTVNYNQQGIILQVNSDDTVNFIIDPIKFTNYLASTDEQVARILQQIQQTTNQNSTNTSIIQNQNQWKQIQAQISQALSSEFNGQVNLEEQIFVNFILNNQTNTFELENNNSTKRLLTQRRILFRKLRKFFKRVGRVFKKIAKVAIKVIRKAAPIIGAVVGTIAGIPGGPAGMVAGAKIGYAIGSVAQSFVKACIPQNSLKLKCDPKKVLKQVVSQGASFVIGKATGISDYNPFKK